MLTMRARRQAALIGATATLIALVGGASAGQALLSMQSSLSGNWWETESLAPAPGPTVSITGCPFDATFDTNYTSSTRTWTITNHSKTQAADMSGIFRLRGTASANADAVHVYYKVNTTPQGSPNWSTADGGTLAHPKPFSIADLIPASPALAPGKSIDVVVVTTFTDPKTGIAATDRGDFDLSYQFENGGRS